MPTIFSHPIPPIFVALGLGQRIIPMRLLVAGIVCAVLPDLDVVGFKLGISYGETFGHRGFSHSLIFALIVGVIGWLIAPWLRTKRFWAFLFCGGCVASHIALDALTNGGLGVALFSPFSDARYFFSWTPVEVSPLSIKAFFSQRGADVLFSEFFWIWLPCAVLMVFLWVFCEIRAGNKLGK